MRWMRRLSTIRNSSDNNPLSSNVDKSTTGRAMCEILHFETPACMGKGGRSVHKMPHDTVNFVMDTQTNEVLVYHREVKFGIDSFIMGLHPKQR